MPPVFAMIIPLNEIAGMPGVPTHPIAPGGQPGRPDQGLPPPGWPGGPNVPSQGPGFPTNPIAPGGQQPGIDNSLPPMPPGWETFPKPTPPQAGHPANPIILPGSPTHPIAQPPGTIWPNIPEVHTKAGILAWVPGYGYRWIVVQPPQAGQPLPPTAQPKA